MQNLRHKRAGNCRLVHKALSASSLHTEAALAPGLLVITIILGCNGRLGTREKASVALLRRAGLLNELRAVAEESRGSRRHANGI
jgi:hypothetical protein